MCTYFHCFTLVFVHLVFGVWGSYQEYWEKSYAYINILEDILLQDILAHKQNKH